ncbi:hypothetical protein FKR81_37710 [Lentzea tibetensis]|uniref:CDP-diacylglycerol--glycerol-3-phosphate 3-phosphatidyltransferase n=1 Tax=Lentzea tibetensis TaxID=2591470 RepID=A0A563EH78_9PSEU|nr:CDP-alcohol phosphatidyltransferase family protein [Lentzea tibetensis]TWP45961.1 hypothetical protein FKR81_37710 [Lentzea tibetensis]
MRSLTDLRIDVQLAIATVRMIYPILLALLRVSIGLAFFIWGRVPTSNFWFLALLLAGGSALFDGRLRRCLLRSGAVGGVMDTIGDKVFVACVFVKLGLSFEPASWVCVVLLVKYVAILGACAVHVGRMHYFPVPDVPAHIASATGIVAAIYSAVSPDGSHAALCIWMFLGASLVHVTAAWACAFSPIPPKLPTRVVQEELRK